MGNSATLLTLNEREAVQESAVRHYKGFIEVASCLRGLKEEVAAVGEHLDALQSHLPALSEACAAFSDSARQNLTRRAQNKRLLSKPSLQYYCECYVFY